MTKDPIFERKKNRAIEIMARKGMWRSNYAPPCHVFLWKMGIHVPPPPFSHFWTNFFSFAAIYTPFWGAVMWFIFWKSQGESAIYALVTAGIAGFVFGIVMAAFQRWRKKANDLPEWEQL